MNLKQLRRIAAAIPTNIERKEATPEQKLELEIKAIKDQIIDAVKAKADLQTVTAMQKQLDALDVKLAERHGGGGAPEESLNDFLQKDEGMQRVMRDKPSKFSHTIHLDAKQAGAVMERKTAITTGTVGIGTSGVLQYDRPAGIVTEARQALTVRDVLSSRPTSLGYLDFVKVNSPLNPASPQQGDAHTKLENAVTFTTASQKVATIATWIPASRQIMDDFSELSGFLSTGLSYYVNLAEEKQLLTGSGSAVDLYGLITQATAFDTALLGTSWTRIDIVARAIQQIMTAKEVAPSFIALNPVDYWAILLTKDTQGRYLSNGMDPFFGLRPVVTTSIASGTFLVGSGSAVASEIRDRMGMTVEIATQHGTYFTENMIAIRAEKRLALVVYRPASFIVGSFTQSPT